MTITWPRWLIKHARSSSAQVEPPPPSTPESLSPDDEAPRVLKRTESTVSCLQQRRNIYINMDPPSVDYDSSGRPMEHNFASNRIRTAKYTLLTFVPKNLFEQFRNVANLYFLFLVILQCIPIFGVTEPAVSAMPLIAILIITSIKDAIEDFKRHQSDQKVNQSLTRTLSHWRNVNLLDFSKGRSRVMLSILGYLSMILGLDNEYTQVYQLAQQPGLGSEDRLPLTESSQPQPMTTTITVTSSPQVVPDQAPADSGSSPTSLSLPSAAEPSPSASMRSPDGLSPNPMERAKRKLSARGRSDSIRSSFSNLFRRAPYRPGAIPHSVLYREPINDARRHTLTPLPSNNSSCAEGYAGDPPVRSCEVQWQEARWQDIRVGDYVKICNDEDIPADVVILSTSENDNLCYVETQNLDGETNLKLRQGLPGTAEIRSVHDCERAKFYIESEPPHVNLYQYSAVLRWHVECDTQRQGVSHGKADAITYNNIMLRGCVLRNTEWVIGIVVFTGNDTKIMLNSGSTPSKRSKLVKATNPHVVANFGILAVISVISSIMDSVQFNGSGSSPLFDYGIEGNNASYSGFLTFWVTLILYQNIVPISLYISVEIVKTLAAYFIFADIELYHEETDTPCIPRAWNISDDLGQIEYIFSDKTGTLTQNVMEFRKCTINGSAYGVGITEAQKGAAKCMDPEKAAETQENPGHSIIDDAQLEELRKVMYEQQARMFTNKYLGPNPSFVDPNILTDLAKDDAHATAIQQFFLSLALCHSAIAKRDEENPNSIEYKPQSPDEAALLSTARDLGFAFLGSENQTLSVDIKGTCRKFDLLNVLEFNSNRKRMSVIIRPHDSNKRLLLCKGADSVIYERLSNDFGTQSDLEQTQSELRVTTNAHLEAFAREGLRTLCLAYRFIGEQEYEAWNERFQEANTSIHNREDKVEALSEEIERDLLLMGGTAIEDRLQDGVPETIAELAKSGIKLWVLTGDKTETAINIGLACNLLTPDMELLTVVEKNREDTQKRLDEALAICQQGTRRHALIIDGTTLKYALDPKCNTQFLELAMQCESVLCCRVSPKQKAMVVTLVKKRLNVMTLAIGDGANDVSMIQEANIGIGISGVEGRQAVMASDYAIAQFRYLRKLLLVHGRWSYLRMAEMIMGFFYKNIVWTFCMFWYQIFCQFNGTMMYDYFLVTLYNLIFTSLPIIFLGIWDQDVSAEISLRYPELYRMGLRNDKFTGLRFWLTMFDSICQSVVCFFFPYMLLVAGTPEPSGLITHGVYEIGTIVSSISVCIANLYVTSCIFSYTWIQIAITFVCILLYYAFIAVYSQLNDFVFAGQVRLFGTGMYWLILVLTVTAAFVPRFAVLAYRRQYHPCDNDIIREIELARPSSLRHPQQPPSCQPPQQQPPPPSNDICLEDVRTQER